MHAFLRSLPLLTVAGATFLFCSPSFAQGQAAWTTFKGDTARTGASTARVTLPLSLQWSFSSDGPARSYHTSPLVIGAPGRQRAVFASGRFVYALDLTTGQQLWRSTEMGTDITAPLTLLSDQGGDSLVGVQSNGIVFALRSTDGGRLWSTDIQANVSDSAPLIVETDGKSRIFVPVNTSRIVALDSAGKIDSSFKLALDSFGQPFIGSPALATDNSRFFVQLTDGRLFAIDPVAGRVLWNVRLPARPSATPLVAGENVITAVPNQIAAMSTQSGVVSWRFRPRGNVTASPALQTKSGQSTLFYGTRNGFFQAINAQTGELKWEKNLGYNFTGSPLVLDSLILTGTSNGLLLGLSPQNGEVLWQYRLRTEREITVRTSDDTITDEQQSSDLTADEVTAAVTRVFPVSSAPVAIDDNLLVLGDNAVVYSFTSRPFDADPPRALFPSITVPDSRNNLVSLDISPDVPQIFPGTGPVYFALEIMDVGSGVNPSTLSATFDNLPLDAARLNFSPETGTLTVMLNDPKLNDLALSDGVRTLSISARDYAGNEMRYAVSFLVDNTAPAPEAVESADPVEE